MCVPLGWSWSESVIQDHSDHGASKEPINLLWTRIHRFLWCTVILVTLDHWSWSGSFRKNTPLVRSGFISSFDAPRSEWSSNVNPYPDPNEETQGMVKKCTNICNARAGHTGCVPLGWSGSGFVIQDRLYHGASKEPLNRSFFCSLVKGALSRYFSITSKN